MLRPILQFHINFANIPYVHIQQSLHFLNNHTCNMTCTEGSNINLLWIGWCHDVPQCFSEKLKNFGAAAETAGPDSTWNHFVAWAAKTAKMFETLQKYSKNWENMCFAIEILKTNFVKTLLNLAKSLDFHNILQNSSALALPVKGECTPPTGSANCGKYAKCNAFCLLFAIPLQGGFAAKFTVSNYTTVTTGKQIVVHLEQMVVHHCLPHSPPT